MALTGCDTLTHHCSSWSHFLYLSNVYLWGVPGQGSPDRRLGLGAEVPEPSVICIPPPPPQLPLRPALSQDCRDLLQRLLERDPSRRISFQDFFAHPWVDLEHMPNGESLAQAVSNQWRWVG